MKKIHVKTEAEVFLDFYIAYRQQLADEYIANVAMVRQKFWYMRHKKIAAFAYHIHVKRLSEEYGKRVAGFEKEYADKIKLYYHGINL
jgi:hypothetical protein